MKFKDLSKKDIELIKNSMLENSVSLTAEALECKETMPKEVFERNMSDSKRLVYLVNVLNGVVEYDK